MTSKISVAARTSTRCTSSSRQGHQRRLRRDIEWNFAKFLVDRNGNVMARFGSRTAPDEQQVTQAIEKALAAEAAKTATAAAK
jgi:glutathione peroxidase-family protein